MSAVRITILPAFRPVSGLIGARFGAPAIIERTLYTGKVLEITAELEVMARYADTLPGDWVASVRVIDGRKPAGFDKAKAKGVFNRDGRGLLAPVGPVAFHYVQRVEDGSIWRSEAQHGDMQAMRQGVTAGYLHGQPRAAVAVQMDSRPARVFYALDANGKETRETPQALAYVRSVNLDERGIYSADVCARGVDGEPQWWQHVYSLRAEGRDLEEVVDGFMRHKDDMRGLASHLISLGFIPAGSTIEARE